MTVMSEPRKKLKTVCLVRWNLNSQRHSRDLKLAQRCCWRFRSSSSIKARPWLHCLTLQMKTVRSFETSGCLPNDIAWHLNILCWCSTPLFKYEFCVNGSVYSWSILIIVQRDATQSSLFIILQVHSTCFGCQPHPSSGVHKTVTAVSDTAATSLQRGQWPTFTFEEGSCTKNMTSTGGYSYSFVYSWWWVRFTPETCKLAE